MNAIAHKVALVMPVHNRRDTTLRALRSLQKVNRPGIDIKLFVVDDGSTDGTSEAIAREYPLEYEIIKGDGTLHYAAGTNRGIEKALDWSPHFIVTMNDDSVFHEDFLLKLVQTAVRFPKAVIGSLLLLWDRPQQVFQVDPKWNSVRGGWVFPEALTAFTAPKEPFKVECIVGNCVLFPVDAIKQVGLMDEANFPHGWGDAQYAIRIKNAGWDLLIEPRSLVWCEPNTYPTSLHKTSAGEQLRNVFLNPRHPSNLGRQFKALWHSAPSKMQALAAFSAYTARLGLKAIGLMQYARNGQQ